MNHKSRILICLTALCLLISAASLPGWSHHAQAGGKDPININKASVEELVQLPRVGAKVAQRIVEYRTRNGSFKSVEDLTTVRGIGDKMMEQLRPMICVK